MLEQSEVFEQGHLDTRAACDPLTIVGWLWKQEKSKVTYTPEHVNTWAKMLHRNVTLPHRFVLLTDQLDADYDPLIEPVPLWDDWRTIKNDNWGANKAHCYVRLKAFSEEASELLGQRFVSIDLDCVVLQNLDDLFDRPDDFLIYRRQVQAIPFDQINAYQGSMWMMTAGARKQVWEKFNGMESIHAARKYMGTDQAWYRHILGPDEKGWSTLDGVYGWPAIRRELRWKRTPPPDARIVFFYGGVKPWNFLRPASDPKSLVYGDSYKWISETYQ